MTGDVLQLNAPGHLILYPKLYPLDAMLYLSLFCFITKNIDYFYCFTEIFQHVYPYSYQHV